MTPYLLIAATLLGQATVEPGRTCPSFETKARSLIVSKLSGVRSSAWRRLVARGISSAIVREAKRHNLDPVVMLSIAWIESGFRPDARGAYGGVGRRNNEAGVWQLIPGDSPVLDANKALMGCDPPRVAGYWPRRVWAKRWKGEPCEAPDVAAHRQRVGWFHRLELSDLVVGTWIAAREMRAHIDNATKRFASYRWPAAAWWAAWSKANPRVDRLALARYVTYNVGSHRHSVAGFPYFRRLFSRYSRVRALVCNCGDSPRKEG